jgi:hypothetical protein
MKNALISPEEKIYSYDGTLLGERIAEVSATPFEIAPPLFWVECNDDVVADQWYWNGSTCVKVPEPPVPVITPDAQTTGTGGPNIIA